MEQKWPEKPYLCSSLGNMMPSDHTPVLMFFPIPEHKSNQAIHTFREGFNLLLKTMPLLTGSVKCVACGTGQKGTMGITLPTWSPKNLFFVKSLRGQRRYNYQLLREKNFPPSALPLYTFTQRDYHFLREPPVIYIQVTLLDGGLVLSACVHHSVSDGPGQNAIIRFYASCCRGEHISIDKVNQVWRLPNLLSVTEKGEASMVGIPGHRHHSSPDPMKAHNVVRRKRWWDPIVQPIRLKLQSYLAAILLPYMCLFYTTRLISFSSEDLARLKDLAWKASLSSRSKTLQEREMPTFISTLDAVAALMYICILSACLSVQRPLKPSAWTRFLRFLRIQEPSSISISSGQEEVQMSFPKNLRSHFRPPLDRDTVGNIFLCTQVGFPVSSLSSPSIETVGQQARCIRAAIQAVDLAYLTRVVEALRTVPDVRCVGYTMDKQWGIVPSSWREQDMGQLDWGEGIKVKVEGARMPKLPMGGYFIVFPQGEDERLDVSVCLNNAEMKALLHGKEGELLRQWGQWMD